MAGYNGYNVGDGLVFSWSATDEMKAQGYSDTPSYMQDTIFDAISVWEKGVKINLSGTSVVDHASVFVGYKLVSNSIGTSAYTVFTDPDGDGEIGATYGNNVGEGSASIYLNLAYEDRYNLDKIEEIITHEAGHIMGLADSSEVGSIMNPTLDGDPSLSEQDKAYMKALYGETADPLAGAVTSSSGADSITGTTGSDTVYSAEGNDTLSGGAGIDYLFGQGGDDLIYGNLEVDYIGGGDGNDTIYGGQNSGSTTSDAYGNMRQQDGIETLLGGGGDDVIYGNYGDEKIYGQSGNDALYGGQGNDTITAWSGDDLIAGNRGNDYMLGGDGADTFLFGASDQGADLIADFDGEEGDRIDISGSYSLYDGGSVVWLYHDGGQIQINSNTLANFDTGWVI